MKASSPPLAEKFGGITTTSLVGNRDKATGRQPIAAGLSYPITQGTNLSPPWLTVFMGANNPMCYREHQLASAVVANPRSLLQNWSQVSLGGQAKTRNREPRGKPGTLGFEWCAKAQTRLLRKKKIKHTPPPPPSKTTWSHQENFTTYRAWLRRPMPLQLYHFPNLKCQIITAWRLLSHTPVFNKCHFLRNFYSKKCELQPQQEAAITREYIKETTRRSFGQQEMHTPSLHH